MAAFKDGRAHSFHSSSTIDGSTTQHFDFSNSIEVATTEHLGADTRSMSSSILDYRRENGRTYHGYKDGKYPFPNDQAEIERMDLQHNVFLLTLDNKLGLCPLNMPDGKPKRVLDVGTGTGAWAMDYADEHPESKVIGFDLSPIQPNFVPPNVEFYVDDLDEPWTYDQPFDYIHSRMMTSSVADWAKYLGDIYNNLSPGGYVELHEMDLALGCDDDTLADDSPIIKWLSLIGEASIKLGRPFQPMTELKALMAEAGFVDVVETKFQWPINDWPKDPKHKDLGLWTIENTHFGLEAVTIGPLTRGHGWTKEEVTVLLTSVRKELMNRSIHAYWPIYAIYGKKPEA